MLISMTGYGAGENKNKNHTFNVDIKAVNNRFIDIVLKTNVSNLPYEDEIITYLKKKCVRGRININLNVTANNENGQMFLNSSKLSSYMKILNKIKNEGQLQDNISLNNVLAFPDLINKSETSDFHLKYKNIIMKTVKFAVNDLNGFRKLEGQNLTKDIKKVFNKSVLLLKKIESLASTYTKKELLHYKEKVKSIVPNNIKLDNDRVYQEIAIIMEKKDINEEIIRLKSHMKLFSNYFSSKNIAGKKMNFILQEMTREINTIGSKTDNTKINHLVIDIKDNLEKIKEQVQNIL